MTAEQPIPILFWLAVILTTTLVIFTAIEHFKLQKTYNELNERYLFIMQEALAECNPGAHFIVSKGEIRGCVVDNKTVDIVGGYWTDKDKLEICGCDKP